MKNFSIVNHTWFSFFDTQHQRTLVKLSDIVSIYADGYTSVVETIHGEYTCCSDIETLFDFLSKYLC